MRAGADTKPCLGCGNTFQSYNGTQLYCTVKCRKRVNNAGYQFRKTNGPPKRVRMFPDWLALRCMVAHPDTPEAKTLRDRLLPVIIEAPKPKQEPPKPKPAPAFVLPPRKYPSLPSLLARVSAKTGLTEIAIRSRSQSASVSCARQEFYFIAASETLYSTAEIGRFLGRDHTTILHGISAHCERNNLPHPRGGPTSARARTKQTMQRRMRLREQALA